MQAISISAQIYNFVKHLISSHQFYLAVAYAKMNSLAWHFNVMPGFIKIDPTSFDEYFCYQFQICFIFQ